MRTDPRTLAREWIERELPNGSFLVMEAWGPELLSPNKVWLLSSMQRRYVIAHGARPIYAMVSLPMFEITPELSEAFYDLTLYPDADTFVLSNAIGTRYARNPDRYAQQIGFYAQLEKQFAKVAEFGSPEVGRRENDVPHITIYQRRGKNDVPFAKRKAVTGPVALAEGLRRPRHGEAAFFCELGLQYETFGFLSEAIDSYGRGLAVGPSGMDLRELIHGTTRCLLGQKREADALHIVESFADQTGSASDAEYLRELAARLKTRSRG
jgi:hypothetical protein